MNELKNGGRKGSLFSAFFSRTETGVLLPLALMIIIIGFVKYRKSVV